MTQYGGGPRSAPVAYGNLPVERVAGDTDLTRGGWRAFANTGQHEQLRQRGTTRVVIVVEDAANDPSPAAHAERFRSIVPSLGATTTMG